jgi:hypothetical protein
MSSILLAHWVEMGAAAKIRLSRRSIYLTGNITSSFGTTGVEYDYALLLGGWPTFVRTSGTVGVRKEIWSTA